MIPAEKHRISWRSFCPVSLTLQLRAIRDYMLITVLGMIGGLSFHWLYVTFVPMYNLKYRLKYIKRMPAIVKGMIGEDILDIISTTSLGSFAYLHPISLSVLITFAVIIPTGLLVGPVDRGTVDLLLATPTSRKKLSFNAMFSSALAGAVLIGAMLLGTWIGIQRTELDEPYVFSRIMLCCLNLYAFYMVIAAVATFASAFSTLRSTAVGWSLAVGIVTYMVHFLSEWWVWIQKIAVFGPLHYYRPIKIATGKYDPTSDILILFGAAAVLFILAMIRFSRRDITVV